MPKAHTKRGRNIKTAPESVPYKVPGTEYARVIKALGDCKFMCQVSQTEEILASLRGKLRNRGRVVSGDIVLVSRRDFQKQPHLDILHKYDEFCANRLETKGELKHLKDLGDCNTGSLIFDYGSDPDEYYDLEPNQELSFQKKPKDSDEINFDDI